MKRLAVAAGALLLVVNVATVGFVAVSAFVHETEPRAVPVGSAIAYEGRLSGGDLPFDGMCEFTSVPFDAAVGGSQVGATLQLPETTASNGLFSTSLAFGPQAFATDETRLLEVSGQCPAASGFTVLPREELSSTLLAQFASYAPRSGLTEIPASLADVYDGVVVVAKSGGDFTSIQAAMNSIQPNSGDRYLVWVAPGVYEERVTVKAYVELVGAGRLVTIIRSPGEANIDASATVTMNTQSSLRNLTIENTGGGAQFATGMVMKQGGAVRITDVDIRATGSPSSYGIHNTSTSLTAVNTNIKVEHPAGSGSTGVFLQSGGISDFHDVDVYAWAQTGIAISISGSTTYLTFEQGSFGGRGAVNAYGLFASQQGYLFLRDPIISAYNDGAGKAIGIALVGGLTLIDGGRLQANGGSLAIGIEAYNAGPQIDRIRILVLSATGDNVGIRHFSGASPVITNSNISASGAGARALANVPGDGQSPPRTINVYGSTLTGANNSAGAYTPNITYRFTNSHLNGPRGAIGSYVCVYSSKGDFTPLSASCQ